jgi:hypothetical protein
MDSADEGDCGSPLSLKMSNIQNHTNITTAANEAGHDDGRVETMTEKVAITTENVLETVMSPEKPHEPEPSSASEKLQEPVEKVGLYHV